MLLQNPDELKSKKYDVVIVGCGPAGIFTAYKLVSNCFMGKILMIDKGKNIYNRICPMREKSGTACANCKTCSIMSGFGGAGAFSDCKLSLHPIGVGGDIANYIGESAAIKLADEVDNVFKLFNPDADKRKVVGGPESYNKALNKFCRNKDAFVYGQTLELNYCPTRHLGTDGTLIVMRKMFEYLYTTPFVDFAFETEVSDVLKLDDNNYYTITMSNKKGDVESVLADKVVLAPGRVGNGWIKHIAQKLGISTQSKFVDIGVRVETDAEITKEATDMLYDMKFYSIDPNTGYKVRTFCTNPNGFVSEEHYGDCAVANGHSFANKKSNKTNFAILVNIEDINFKLDDAEKFMKFVNSYTGGKLAITNAVDFIYNSRICADTKNRLLEEVKEDYTLQSAKRTKFSSIYPADIYDSIANFMRLLDNMCMRGLCGPKTWIYGPEVKFYSNVVVCDEHSFSTSQK